MARTSLYRQQHAELTTLVEELRRHLTADALAGDARAARAVLSKLAGRLRLHLTAEDTILYPELAAHAQKQVRDTAQRFQAEMGDIHSAFTAYLRQWPTAEAIQLRPQEFVRQTRDVAAVLARRIRAEDEELYRLADSAG